MKYIKCGSEVFEFSLKPLTKKCSYCEERAYVRPEGTSLALCSTCFLKFCEKRVKENVLKHRMLKPKDRVGVFLSGGKDSAALVGVLKRIFPDLSLVGIHLNLGIRYYSEVAQEAVTELCKRFDVPLVVLNLSERENLCIDDFVFTSFKDKVCSVCGAIKRYYFSRLAKELRVDVMATGHHLDDTLSTMLSLFFNGDFVALSRLRPVLEPLYEGQVKKIKPLYSLPEIDIFHYSMLSELPVENCGCPHGEVTPAKAWKSWLQDKLKEDKTFKFRLFSIFTKKLIPLIPKDGASSKEEFRPCQVCGEPTPSKSQVCVKCRRVTIVSRVKDKKLEWTAKELFAYLRDNPGDVVIFDTREMEDYRVSTLDGAIWVDPQLVQASNRELFKFFKDFRKKKLFFFCYSGKLSYLFVLKLQKLGFEAYNLKDPQNLLEKAPSAS